MRHERLCHESSSFVNAELRIEPCQFVVLIDEASICPEKSDKRILRAEVMLQAQDAEGGILINQSWVRGESLFGSEISGRVVGCCQQTKRIPTDFPGKLHRIIGIDNSARVHGGNCRVEDIDAFEEERAH